MATAASILYAGAKPVFVDVDPVSYTMDPGRIEAAITGRTRAIMPVHLYGQMADMDPILELSATYELTVVEDACQAHGAEYFSKREGGWRKAGSMGRAAAFSFYPAKNLGACGEAGAITTGDPELARTCRMLRDHGQSAKYAHDFEGYNGRVDAIQAGILQVKLRHLARWNERRREHARRYTELLSGADGILALPFEPPWSRPVYHLYVVRVSDRDRVQQELTAAGIGTGVHYPTPLHLLKAHERFGFRRGDFPVSERAAAEVLSLPMFPELTTEEQRTVATQLVARVRSEGQEVGGATST